MYRWYRNAEVCYAYLAGVDALDDEGLAFQKSRWFTRGWTLQELLAPRRVEFYASDWHPLGTALSLLDKVSSVTGIDRGIIEGNISVRDISVAKRMSWASKR
jgi:hypothetical protein